MHGLVAWVLVRLRGDRVIGQVQLRKAVVATQIMGNLSQAPQNLLWRRARLVHAHEHVHVRLHEEGDGGAASSPGQACNTTFWSCRNKWIPPK